MHLPPILPLHGFRYVPCHSGSIWRYAPSAAQILHHSDILLVLVASTFQDFSSDFQGELLGFVPLSLLEPGPSEVPSYVEDFGVGGAEMGGQGLDGGELDGFGFDVASFVVIDVCEVELGV